MVRGGPWGQGVQGIAYFIPTKTFCGQAADVRVGATLENGQRQPVRELMKVCIWTEADLYVQRDSDSVF